MKIFKFFVLFSSFVYFQVNAQNIKHYHKCKYDSIQKKYCNIQTGDACNCVDSINLTNTDINGVKTKIDAEYVKTYFNNGFIFKEESFDFSSKLIGQRIFSDNKLIFEVKLPNTDEKTYVWFDEKENIILQKKIKNGDELIEIQRDFNHVSYYDYYRGNIIHTKEVLDFENYLDGICYTNFPSGNVFTLIEYKKGKLIKAEVFDRSGKNLNCGEYYNGNGVLKTWQINANDSLFIQKSCIYKNYKKNGACVFFESNGDTIEVINYTDDIVNGFRKLYFDGNIISRILYYKNGEIDGECIFFNKDGSINKRRTYVEGKFIKEENY